MLNNVANEALTSWGALMGIGSGKEHEPWHMRETLEKLRSSRTLDGSGLTTLMMLRGLLDQHLVEQKFSWKSVMLRPRAAKKTLKPFRSLWRLLHGPEVSDAVDAFRETLRQAAVHYGVGGKRVEDITEILDSRSSVGFLRYDALASFAKLEHHQFCHGQPSDEPFKYNNEIYEFWNVNSLVASMRQHGGPLVSLVLVRDPGEALASYFLLSVVNGQTITVLSDREEGPHPAYQRMSRRPDRNLENRAAKNWFPYDLLDLARGAGRGGDSGRLYAKRRDQLVPINTNGVKLRKISELHAEQFLWLVMMFDLVKDAYGATNKKLGELSYTGQMTVEPHALVSREADLVRAGTYAPLEIPRVTRESLERAHADLQWERTPARHNQWMVDRYGSQVPEEVFQLVGKDSVKQLPPAVADLVAGSEERKKMTDEWGDAVDRSMGLETLSPLSFGTADKIKNDVVWAARHNQMKVIQRLAEEEMAMEKDGVAAWYRKKIRENRQVILDAVARKSMKLTFVSWRSRTTSFETMYEPHVETKNAVEVKFGKNFYDALGERAPEVLLGSVRHSHFACAVSGKPATVFAKLSVESPAAVAQLTRTPVEELHFGLANWSKDDPYTGNHILSRLDPVDWVLHNPWSDVQRSYLDLDVGVCLSAKVYNQLRALLGLPHETVGVKVASPTWKDKFHETRVRLNYPTETRSGIKFAKGEVLHVTSTSGSGLTLFDPRDPERRVRGILPQHVTLIGLIEEDS